MPKQDKNVLDLDALIGDAPVVKFREKVYKVDPSLEDVMKVVGSLDKDKQIGSDKMRKLAIG